MNNWRDQLLLILAALIWGGAFVAQSAGMDYIGPWTFLCVRSFIAFAALSALMPFLDRIRHTEKPRTETERKYLFKAAFCCGAVLCAASIFQQAGIQYTSVGKDGLLKSGIFGHDHAARSFPSPKRPSPSPPPSAIFGLSAGVPLAITKK